MYINEQKMIREQIIHNVGTSFTHKVYDHFTMPWHYHDEYELIVITSGGGKRFVGDYVGDFNEGDLLLFGSQLPHYHMCYGLVNNQPELVSSCQVIQFTHHILPDSYESIEEFSVVANLLARSHRGVHFTNPPSVERICRMMRQLDKLKGVKRVMTLFRILEMLGKSEDYQLLTSDNYNVALPEGDYSDPVNQIYRYLQKNFRGDIALDDIAHKLGYNSTALCRHYKKRTQKSIFESLQEIRIAFACKLLTNSSLSVIQVAYESGYKNLTNFNRQFRSITNLTPSAYKQMSRSGL